MEGFAGQIRIVQVLLILQSGIGTKELLRRWAIYKKLVKLRKARKAQRLWPAQEAELQALQQAARDAIAHGKAKRKEYLALSHDKTKREEWDARRRANPHRMATLHGKETTSGRPRAEGGRATSLLEAQALRTNVVRGV